MGGREGGREGGRKEERHLVWDRGREGEGGRNFGWEGVREREREKESEKIIQPKTLL